MEHYKSTYEGAEVDAAIAAALAIDQTLESALAPLNVKINQVNIKCSNNSTDADLNIMDESGNIILQLAGGHIRTKNFDSSDAAKSGQHLKICIIGNSYTADSWMYLPFILKNYGITIEVGCYIRSSGTLQNAVNEWSTGASSVSSAFYYINTKTQTSWQTISLSASPQMATRYTNWDIMVLQQGSEASVDYSTYSYARQLEGLILDNVGKPVKFGWNINHNRASSGSDYEAVGNTILSNISRVCEKEPMSMIFPYGTAVFNARTNQTLAAIGAGGNLWYSDMVHLQEGLPCYIANLANVEAIFREFFPHLSVMGDITRPTAANISAWAVKSTNGTSVGVTEANCRLAQICAVLANNYIFEIKTI